MFVSVNEYVFLCRSFRVCICLSLWESVLMYLYECVVLVCMSGCKFSSVCGLQLSGCLGMNFYCVWACAHVRPGFCK